MSEAVAFVAYNHTSSIEEDEADVVCIRVVLVPVAVMLIALPLTLSDNNCFVYVAIILLFYKKTDKPMILFESSAALGP